MGVRVCKLQDPFFSDRERGAFADEASHQHAEFADTSHGAQSLQTTRAWATFANESCDLQTSTLRLQTGTSGSSLQTRRRVCKFVAFANTYQHIYSIHFVHTCAPFSSLRFRRLGSVVGPVWHLFLQSGDRRPAPAAAGSRRNLQPHGGQMAGKLAKPLQLTCGGTHPPAAHARLARPPPCL